MSESKTRSEGCDRVTKCSRVTPGQSQTAYLGPPLTSPHLTTPVAVAQRLRESQRKRILDQIKIQTKADRKEGRMTSVSPFARSSAFDELTIPGREQSVSIVISSVRMAWYCLGHQLSSC